MGRSLSDRLEHAWNAFRKPNSPPVVNNGMISYGHRPDRRPVGSYSYRQIIAPILAQITVDAEGVEYKHIRLEDEKYKEDVQSELNECLMVSPNLDQHPAHFRRDIISTMLQEGTVAIVPVVTTLNPEITGGYDIKELRVGTVVDWFPEHVRLSLYDQRRGIRDEIVLPKAQVGIVENPHYDIMNEPNSTLQRLIRKLAQLDITDDRLASGKLDIILQLPYTIKHETRLNEAKKRIGDLEDQLTGSRYGVGYIDNTERITQLNRPSENNLLSQVKDLEERMNAQLGLTPEVFFGTADEAAMLNYQNRTVVPIVRAIQEEMHRKFLTKTARSRGHAIKYFRDPFSIVPISQIAEIADKFTRNAIMSPNEVRPIVGLKPVADPESDKLRNRNMPEMPEAGDEKEQPKELEKPEPPADPELDKKTVKPEGKPTDEA